MNRSQVGDWQTISIRMPTPRKLFSAFALCPSDRSKLSWTRGHGRRLLLAVLRIIVVVVCGM